MNNPFKRFLRTKSVTIDKVTFGSGSDNVTDIKNLNTYSDSLYLYIGVSMVSKRVSGIPLELYKIKNKKGDVAEVFEHPLLALLAKPNATQTAREFIELSATHYILSGECFWYLDRGANGAITQMSILRPDFMQVVLSADRKTIVGYEYTANTVYRFAPEDIIHIKNTDPANPLRGVGVVRPATNRILTEIEATKYQSSFFRNQGRPDLAVFADQAVDEDQGADFRSRWKRIFGKNNGGNVAIFGSAIKSIQELNKTPKEMDFIETQKFLRSDILSALHIPEEMVSSMADHATSPQVYKMYLQEAVIPVAEALVDGINAKLVPLVDEAVFFRFDDPTPLDRELLLKETTELKAKGIITANEARAMYNYDPIGGADTLSSAGPSIAAPTDPALQQEAKAIIRNRPILALKLQAIEDVLATLHTTEPKRQMNSIFPNRKAKEAYAKAVNDNIDRKADQVKDHLDTFHEGMLKRILKNDLSPTTFMDVIGEKTLAKATFTPIMVKLYKDGGQNALDALYRKAGEHFFTDTVLLSAIEGRVDFFTSSIVDTTFEILKNKIVDGIKEGHSVDKIAAGIKEYFDDMSTKRARTIAQTETGFVLGKATNDAYAQSAVVTGKEWITVGDEKVREEHVMNDGVVVGKGEAFPNGEHFNGEHTINCRCVIAPTV